MSATTLPPTLRTRRHWQRLDRDLQVRIARRAQTHGVTEAARHFEVSEGAARRACAVTRILPKTVDKIATARALLRALGVKPKELI